MFNLLSLMCAIGIVAWLVLFVLTLIFGDMTDWDRMS
jgi:hypothetical protein